MNDKLNNTHVDITTRLWSESHTLHGKLMEEAAQEIKNLRQVLVMMEGLTTNDKDLVEMNEKLANKNITLEEELETMKDTWYSPKFVSSIEERTIQPLRNDLKIAAKLCTTTLDLLAISAYTAWRNTITGRQSPDQQQYYNRMHNPIIGDLVLEITTFHSHPAIDRIGRLVSVTDEPYPTWANDGECHVRFGTVHTIETLDSRMYKWENCDFVVIPEDVYNHQGKLKY